MTISKPTRILGGVAGLTTLAGFFLGWPPFFLLVPIPLLCGVATVERNPRAGTSLMIWGAALASLLDIPFGIGMAWDMVHSKTFFPIDLLVFIMLLSVLACDVALIVAAITQRGLRAPTRGGLTHIGSRTRWLFGITGVATSSGWLYGASFFHSIFAWSLAMPGVALILGAAFLHKLPRLSEALIIAGTALLTACAMPFWLINIFAWVPQRSIRALIFTVLVLSCDVVLLKTARTVREHSQI